MARRLILGAVGILIATIVAAYLALPLIGELLTPGPLAQPHAATERNCLACHVPFFKRGQDGRCKVCHEDVAEDITARIGLHGRDPRVARQNCASCHTDHKGRDFQISAFDRRTFNHSLTDFPLTGAHGRLQCAGCHKPSAKFRSTPASCVACHKKEDKHQGRFGPSCQGCHNTVAWDQVREFDHSVTGFNLIGKHRTTTCESCHAGRRFVGTPSTCVACHRKDDVHQGARGTNCAQCHVASGWEFVDFNHQRDTRFPLTGSHRATTCASCHGSGERIKRPPMTCIGCHAKDDAHKGTYGRDCAQCHNTTRWQDATFDHARTGFPLRGAHAKIACKTCHIRPAGVVRLPKTCAGCHSRDDPHRGALGATCSSCHNDTRWKPATGFDHARTGFPLIGRHRAIACTSCHTDKTFSAKGLTCASCHADTHHAGRFGRAPNCATCHTAANWADWTFDHGQQTGFALQGRHARLQCYDCHNRPAATARIGSTCAACHRADDVHRGEFGENCAECHTTTDWKSATVRKVSYRMPVGRRRRPPP